MSTDTKETEVRTPEAPARKSTPYSLSDCASAKFAAVGASVIKASKETQAEPANTIDYHTRRITSSWRGAVAGIIETGRLLQEAKEALDHGEFGLMVDEKLPFGRRTAQMLMQIANYPIIANANHASHLPASWTVLHALTELPDRELEQMLADGRINAETARRDVKEIAARIREQGLYRYERVAEALNVLIDFMGKWPNAGELARHVDLCEEGAEVDQDQLAKLPSWIEKLRAECKRIQDGEDLKAREPS
jgi:hypothetical protein